MREPTEMEMRVGRAVYEANPFRADIQQAWEHLRLERQELFIVVARAAIQAMWEPSIEMLDSAKDDVGSLHGLSKLAAKYTARGRALAAWSAMIISASPPITSGTQTNG